MALQSEYEELLVAWRALSSTGAGSLGWSTIPLTSCSPSRVRAGRHFPRNLEALLFGFQGLGNSVIDHLPQGHGFSVSRVDFGNPSHGIFWLALSRAEAGSLEMFTMMALDILVTLDASVTNKEEKRFNLFLSRIRAWQEFMHRGGDKKLGPEAEIGLFGELVFLGSALQVGVEPEIAVQSWIGPLNAVQDFALGTGAIEVKSTIAASGFCATIASLEQLDDSARQPLFLAAVRLTPDPGGTSLSTTVDNIRNLLSGNPACRSLFNSRLLYAGFLDSMAALYQRPFRHLSTRLFPVGKDFPRITRDNVPVAIKDVQYQLDLDQINDPALPIEDALQHLGVRTNGTF